MIWHVSYLKRMFLQNFIILFYLLLVFVLSRDAMSRKFDISATLTRTYINFRDISASTIKSLRTY